MPQAVAQFRIQMCQTILPRIRRLSLESSSVLFLAVVTTSRNSLLGDVKHPEI